jgi:hypothetical protein
VKGDGSWIGIAYVRDNRLGASTCRQVQSGMKQPGPQPPPPIPRQNDYAVIDPFANVGRMPDTYEADDRSVQLDHDIESPLDIEVRELVFQITRAPTDSLGARVGRQHRGKLTLLLRGRVFRQKATGNHILTP